MLPISKPEDAHAASPDNPIEHIFDVYHWNFRIAKILDDEGFVVRKWRFKQSTMTSSGRRFSVRIGDITYRVIF